MVVGPLEVSEKFRVGGGWWWCSDNTVSKVQVLDSRLKTSDFGLDFGLGLQRLLVLLSQFWRSMVQSLRLGMKTRVSSHVVRL